MTRTRFRKVASDFSVRWGRTLLTLLGLSVGLFGLGAVLIAFAILSSDLDENFARTYPPNVIVSAEGVGTEALRRLQSLEGVTAIDDRPIVPARIEVGMGRWMPMSLFVVRDFNRMPTARFFPQQGAWPPPTGEMLVERSGRFWIRERPGVEMRLRIGGALPFSARLGGFAFDPGQAPSPMDRVIYGYITPETYRAWTGQPLHSRLLIRVDTAAVTAAAVAARADQLLRASGAQVRRVESFESPEHPHQFQLNSFVAMLGALAVFCFVMCAVLIVNLIDSIMANEQRSIGVMRALGARRRLIAFDYLLAMGMLGLVAGAASLPFALPTGRGIAAFIAMAVNFDLLNPQGPVWLVPFVLAVAGLIPLAVAGYRVFRTSRIPVREALSRVEPGQKTALGESFDWLLHPFPLLQRIAIRSLARRPWRVLLTAAILSLGVAFFMTALNVRSSMLATVDAVERTKPHDLAITFPSAYPNDQIATWLGDFPSIRTWEYWAVVEATLIEGEAPAANPLPVFGIPSDSVALRPDVLDGRWLDHGRAAGIVITQAVVNDRPEIQVGSRYALRRGGRSLPVEVIGVVKEFGEGRIYAPLALLRGLGAPTGRSNHLVLTLDDHSAEAQNLAIAELEESVVASDWQIAGAMGTRMWEQVILAHLVDIGRLFAIIAGIALFIGAMGLASSISVGVVERYREIAVLKAIGGRSRAIAAIFTSEALLVALLGTGFALMLAPWLSRQVADKFGTMMIEYPFDYRAADYVYLLALAVAVLIALLACILPVRTALRMTIRKALRTE